MNTAFYRGLGGMISSLCALMVAGMMNASAQDIASDAFTVTGPTASGYTLLQARRSDYADKIATVLITRASGSEMLMEIAYRCEQNDYTYLAMRHNPARPITQAALASLARQSSQIMTTSLRALSFTSLTSDPYDAPLVSLKTHVCAAD